MVKKLKTKSARIPKRFKWVVEIWVDRLWVADGFDLTPECADDMLAGYLEYAYGSEIRAKVISSPDKNLIRKAQGQ